MIILDCCHAGAVPQRAFEGLPGAVKILCATSETGIARTVGENGVLTGALCDVLGRFRAEARESWSDIVLAEARRLAIERGQAAQTHGPDRGPAVQFLRPPPAVAVPDPPALPESEGRVQVSLRFTPGAPVA